MVSVAATFTSSPDPAAKVMVSPLLIVSVVVPSVIDRVLLVSIVEVTPFSLV